MALIHGCRGSTQGFLAANTAARPLQIGGEMNVVVPSDDSVVVDEVYEAVVWITNADDPGQLLGRLASSILVVA